MSFSKFAVSHPPPLFYFIITFCPWLPLATSRMTFRPQQRDSRGRFIQSVQLPSIEEQPAPIPPPQIGGPLSHFQHAIIALSTPLQSSVPVSEALANLAAALRSNSPNTDPPTTSQPKPANIPPSPTRYVPPPRYVTDPPLPRPDFNAPGSGESPQPDEEMSSAEED